MSHFHLWILLLLSCQPLDCTAEVIWPYLKDGITTTTPKPWRLGELVQTKPVDTYPWVTRACPRHFCDPAPVFKVVAASPTGAIYNLLEVIYPSNSPDYQNLLHNPVRKRYCDGTQTVHSKCSFFQEFVVYAGGYKPIQILSIHDTGYDDIYLRLRFAELEDEEIGADDYYDVVVSLETTTEPASASEEYDDDNFELFIIYGVILFLLIAVLVCLGICIKYWRDRAETNTPDSTPSLSRNSEIAPRFKNTSRRVSEQKRLPTSSTNSNTNLKWHAAVQQASQKEFVNPHKRVQTQSTLHRPQTPQDRINISSEVSHNMQIFKGGECEDPQNTANESKL